MPSRFKDPFFWGLFSAGGMLTALFLPALFLVVAIVGPLGGPVIGGYEAWMAVAVHPLVRIGLAGFVVLALFHAAHRIRHTLYDGMQLYHLDTLISIVTYGAAAALGLWAATILAALG